MTSNRIVVGWAIFALVLFILAAVLLVPGLLPGRAKAAPPASSAPAISPFLSSTFPADDPSRDSLPPSILPVVILKGSDYEMGRQYGEQARATSTGPARTNGPRPSGASAARRYSGRSGPTNPSSFVTHPNGSTSCGAWPTERPRLDTP